MRASIIILSFLASISLAMPAALESCQSQNKPCKADAVWGEKFACCVGELSCVTRSGSNNGTCQYSKF
ncbi:hypothetical protein N7495_004732 [Penicillium taxi]|uniref:uncharacterized protein n=1 Tax=Penicillium taxi TaxID=168475 RepID=UPI0025454306|nr:uncharacterized protein N7495_004732 [Penicillium taxi]KAJ5899988.1 hypothetical protein N7495_004732 [Penicillium taxi]